MRNIKDICVDDLWVVCLAALGIQYRFVAAHRLVALMQDNISIAICVQSLKAWHACHSF